MTKDTPIGEGLSPEEALNIAENHYGRALRTLEDHLQEIVASGEAPGPETTKITQATSKAMQTIFDERVKIEQYRKKASGVVHDFAIDLDAARDEIGRRLACLRQTAGSGGVPE